MDGRIIDLAARLHLEMIGSLAGGEFGATHVRDGDRRDLVLKIIGGQEPEADALIGGHTLEADVREGVRLATNLRAKGYPAPEYIGAGVSNGLLWTLQELLPGDVPDVMTPGHANQLLALAERHADAAGITRDWTPIALDFASRWAAAAGKHPVTAELAEELMAVTKRYATAPVRTGDVMHSDFHHRNFLAEGDRVTGVFDWELASVGDWRSDVVTLGFWSAILPVVPEATRSVVLERMHAFCEPEVLAFFAAILSLRQLTFDLSVHPERLERITVAIEASIAPWWRSLL